MSESCDVLVGRNWRIEWGVGHFDAVDYVRFTRCEGEEEAYDLQWTKGNKTYKLANVACTQGMLSDRCQAFRQSEEAWTLIGVYEVYVQIEAALPSIQGLCELVESFAQTDVGTDDPLAGSWGAEARGTNPTYGGVGKPEPSRGHGREDSGPAAGT